MSAHIVSPVRQDCPRVLRAAARIAPALFLSVGSTSLLAQASQDQWTFSQFGAEATSDFTYGPAAGCNSGGYGRLDISVATSITHAPPNTAGAPPPGSPSGFVMLNGHDPCHGSFTEFFNGPVQFSAQGVNSTQAPQYVAASGPLTSFTSYGYFSGDMLIVGLSENKTELERQEVLDDRQVYPSLNFTYTVHSDDNSAQATGSLTVYSQIFGQLTLTNPHFGIALYRQHISTITHN